VRFMILIASAALMLLPVAGATGANASPQFSAAQSQPTDLSGAAKKKKKAKPSEKMKSAPSEPPKGAYN
jgi:hypothetical protein